MNLINVIIWFLYWLAGVLFVARSLTHTTFRRKCLFWFIISVCHGKQAGREQQNRIAHMVARKEIRKEGTRDPVPWWAFALFSLYLICVPLDGEPFSNSSSLENRHTQNCTLLFYQMLLNPAKLTVNISIIYLSIILVFSWVMGISPLEIPSQKFIRIIL